MNKRKLYVSGVTAGVLALTGALLFVVSQPKQASAARVMATCNNSATDSATINAAITGSQDGDEIVIDGPCSLTAPITLVGGRTYRGDSRSTVLKQANGANLATMLMSDSYASNSPTTGTPIVLRDMTLDGNKAANTTAATDGAIIRSWQTTVSDMQIQNMHGNGLRVTNLSANNTALTNTQVNGRINNMFITDSDKYGIYVQDSGNSVTDWNMTENWVASSGIGAINMENAAGWTVERNHVYGNQKNAIFADRAFGTSISDNYVEDFGLSATAGTYYGIGVNVQGDTGTTITGNRVFQFGTEKTTNTYRFIGINQVNYGTGVATVTGNTVRGKGTAKDIGLYYSKGNATALNVVSTGNNIFTVGTQRSAGTGVTVGAGV